MPNDPAVPVNLPKAVEGNPPELPGFLDQFKNLAFARLGKRHGLQSHPLNRLLLAVVYPSSKCPAPKALSQRIRSSNLWMGVMTGLT